MAKCSILSKKYGSVDFLIDEKDLWILDLWKPRLMKGKVGHTDYIRCRYKGKEPTVMLHKLIMACKFRMVDHINGNGLDNRRKNLRIVDSVINNGNAKIRKDNRVGSKGISSYKGKYVARLQYKGVRHNLGTFKTLEEAERAYTLKYKEIHNRWPR